MLNFQKIYRLKMVFEENFLRLTVTVRLQKREFWSEVIIMWLTQNKFAFSHIFEIMGSHLW